MNTHQLVDPFGRRITYLRLSVTDRCDFRCTYCMSEDMQFAPRAQILSLEELYAVADVFIGLGVRRIRITGGEPLVRKNLLSLLQRLGSVTSWMTWPLPPMARNWQRWLRRCARLACGA